MKSGKALQTAMFPGVSDTPSLAIFTPRFKWLFVRIAFIAGLVLTVEYRIPLSLTAFPLSLT